MLGFLVAEFLFYCVNYVDNIISRLLQVGYDVHEIDSRLVLVVMIIDALYVSAAKLIA